MTSQSTCKQTRLGELKTMSIFDDDRPCTVEELENVLTAPSGGISMAPSDAYNEVYDGIYIGEGDSAKSIGCMKRLGITHVLNAALGKSQFHVNTNFVMYKRSNIEFLGIEATDAIFQDLTKFFDKSIDFIDGALSSKGKVFVHCVQGMSRSATLVLAYLMVKCHMTVQDATRLVRSKREIFPNPAFLQQLCDLNEKLKKLSHFDPKNICSASDDGENLNPKSICNVELSNIKDTKEECTEDDLEKILIDSSTGLMILPSHAYHQITESVFIGDSDAATEPKLIQQLKVTHVLNACHNKDCPVDTEMYTTMGITFLRIPALDILGFNISQYFDQAADFISGVIEEKGKVLVHCLQGVSRSAVLVIAYLMIKEGMPVEEAVRKVREKREICPNPSFLRQLCGLHKRLKKVKG